MAKGKEVKFVEAGSHGGTYVKGQGKSYGFAKEGLNPRRARTQNYTPDCSDDSLLGAKATLTPANRKHNKQVKY
jgi:hypothetical protein